MSLDAQIASLRAEISALTAAASDEAAIEAVRVGALGKKGSVSALLATLGSIAPEERKAAGAAINGLKAEVTALIEAKAGELATAALDARLAAERVDITLPVQPAPTAEGRIHPVSQVIDEITAIFSDMGFSIAEGPDIETDCYTFAAIKLT
jgi:phenylalanyl-tRNA synthetase alpha chain